MGESEQGVVFVLDELPMMIDRMAASSAHREQARTLLRWFRALRLSPEMRSVRFLLAGSIGIGHVLNRLGEISSINDIEQVRVDPFPAQTAAALLEALATSHAIALSAPSRRKMIELIGTLVPYFLQVLFSEVAKAQAQDGRPITPGKVEQVYREKVLGVDCKTYFDHYYGRLRDYYSPQEERAIKRLLRELAAAGSMTRDACYGLYRAEIGGARPGDEFSTLMTNLENDFYIRWDAAASRYEFACKLLRDWWLRHYGMALS